MLTLVLLPGLDGTGELFDDLIGALDSSVRVQVIRYPNTEPYTYANLIQFARESLPQNEDYVVLGESFSGPIAITLAADCNTRMKALILCCTFASNPRPKLNWFYRLIPLLTNIKPPTFLLKHLLLGKYANKATISAIKQAISKVSPTAMQARIHSIMKTDVSDLLNKIKIPCIYLSAEADKVVPIEATVQIQKGLPHMRVIRLGAPHCLLQTKPALAAEIINAFCREIQNLS